MGVDDALSTRALPGLLALTLVACGGRYSGTSASDDTGGSSSGGKTTSNPPSQAGRNSGSGGAGVGGSGVSMGGVGMSVGGTAISTAGMATGSGGAGIGLPVDPRTTCQRYCDAHAGACPEEDAYACSKTCYTDQIGSPCPELLRQQFECIAAEMEAANSCEAARGLASKYCGAVNGWPLDCDETPCETGISGDPMGCRAVTTCGAAQAELFCPAVSGPVLCSCWVDGRKVSDVMTPYMSSKTACGDADLHLLCLSHAQR